MAGGYTGRVVLAAVVIVAATLGPASSAGATNFVVSTPTQSALSNAITMANSNVGPDQITINATGVIEISSSLPNLATDISVVGPGASQLTVRRRSPSDGLFPIFRVQSATSAVPDVMISGLTVAGGFATRGAGIDAPADSELLLTGVVVTQNKSTAVADGANIFKAVASTTLVR